jgi:hypothetical protein
MLSAKNIFQKNDFLKTIFKQTEHKLKLNFPIEKVGQNQKVQKKGKWAKWTH